jgi:hypothetical protein
MKAICLTFITFVLSTVTTLNNTHEINCWVSTATMVTWTRHSITLYVHFLSCKMTVELPTTLFLTDKSVVLSVTLCCMFLFVIRLQAVYKDFIVEQGENGWISVRGLPLHSAVQKIIEQFIRSVSVLTCFLLLFGTTEVYKMWEDAKILCKDPQDRIWLQSVELFSRSDVTHLTNHKSRRMSYIVLTECIRRKYSFHLWLQFVFDKPFRASIAYYTPNGAHKFA